MKNYTRRRSWMAILIISTIAFFKAMYKFTKCFIVFTYQIAKIFCIGTYRFFKLIAKGIKKLVSRKNKNKNI